MATIVGQYGQFGTPGVNAPNDSFEPVTGGTGGDATAGESLIYQLTNESTSSSDLTASVTGGTGGTGGNGGSGSSGHVTVVSLPESGHEDIYYTVGGAGGAGGTGGAGGNAAAEISGNYVVDAGSIVRVSSIALGGGGGGGGVGGAGGYAGLTGSVFVSGLNGGSSSANYYGSQGGDGADGGNGGRGGSANAQVQSNIIEAVTAPLSLTIEARASGGAGYSGGNGGNGSSGDTSGHGADGGAGGSGGRADAIISSNSIAGSAQSDFIQLQGAAYGGSGNYGGNGAVAVESQHAFDSTIDAIGASTSHYTFVFGTAGNGGRGGDGGDAAVNIADNTANGGEGSDTLAITAEAYSGNGGTGGEAGFGGASASSTVVDGSTFIQTNYIAGTSGSSGGNGSSGSSTITITGNSLFGGAGDDFLRLAIDGTNITSLNVSGNIFDGGDGSDELDLSVLKPNLSVVADFISQTLTLGGYANRMTSIERLDGTSHNDLFRINAGHLPVTIVGGGGPDVLEVSGGGLVDLSGLSLFDVPELHLTDRTGTTLITTGVSQALLIKQALGVDDTVIVRSGTLSDQDIAALHAAGVENVQSQGYTLTIANQGGVTNQPSQLLVGTGDPYATITVTENGVSIGETIVQIDGQWSLPIGLSSDGTHSLVVISSVNGIPIASSVKTFVLDTVADIGGDLAVTTASSTVIGTERSAVGFNVSGLDSDATAIITFSDGTHTATASTSTDGSGTVDLSSFASGVTTVSIAAIDMVGNTAAGSGTTITLQPLATPVAPVVTLAHDTGNPNDKVTRDGTLVVSGTATGATVSYSLDGGATFTSAAPATSDYGEDGPKSVLVKATDALGDSATTDFSFTLDQTTPSAVSLVADETEPTNTATVHYTVTFSEAVTGVDASQFSLLPATGISGAHITDVTEIAGSGGTQYTVAVATGSGDGRLSLGIIGSDIADLAGNHLGRFSLQSISGATDYPVASGDLNGDNRDDLIFASGADLKIGFGSADGSFTPGTTIPLGLTSVNPGGMATGLINSDHFLDVVISDYPTGRILTLLGNGDGTFQAPIISHSTGIGGGLALADFNRDGIIDLAVANTGGSAATTILLGDATGNFLNSTQLPATFDAIEVAAKDLNGDARADVVFTPYGQPVEIFLSNSDGSFTQKPSVQIAGSGSVVLEDVDGDRFVDLVATTTGGSIAIAKGLGDGTFASPTYLATSGVLGNLVVRDLDGDGIVDIAVTGHTNNNVSIWKGVGSGAFVDREDYAVDQQPYGLVAGDFNGDGRVDLAASNLGAQTLTVLSNALPAPTAITIDRTAPTVAIGSGSGYYNQASVAISGTGEAGTQVSLFEGQTAIGSATVAGDGTWTSTVSLELAGSHTIVAKDVDAAGNIGTSNAITLVANHAPVAVDDTFTALENSTVFINSDYLTHNDTDPDGDNVNINGVAAVGNAVHGTVQLIGATVVFTPDANFIGQASFDYTTQDGHGGTDVGTVVVTVITNPPTITSNGGGAAASISLAENTTAVTTVIASDPDPLDVPVYSIFGGPDAFVFAIDAATGALSFKTAPNFEARSDVGGNNIYDVIVQASDGHGGTDTQAIAVTVTNVNEPGSGSVAIASYAENANNTATLTASNSITDPDGIIGPVTYQWQSFNGTTWTNIAGATGATFTNTAAQVGQPLRVTASYSDPFGTNVLISAETAVIGSSAANTLIGTSGADYVIGLAANDSLSGGAGNDTLSGAAGNDTLDGGSGADSMSGGAGNDTFVVDNSGDVVVEASAGTGGGTDIVRTNLSTFSLATIANVEGLTFIGTGNFVGAGNSLDNTIVAGANDDTLDGGTGADRMTGGTGNDVYVVDNAGDVVVEAAGGGTDTIRTTLSSFTLSSNVENLTFFGTGNFAGTGNGLANLLTGGAGDDTLNGAAGTDTLSGGLGNDTYILSSSSDVVVEQANEGSDTVLVSAASYALSANIEYLTYTGAGNFTGTGNSLGNAINGGTGNDTIDGGAGADTMTGGAGNDTYVVDQVGDVVIENPAGGTDTIRTSFANYSLASVANVENLAFVGTANFIGLGNAAANVITGSSGDDTLDGGAGTDTLIGGTGNDTYRVDNSGDVITEAAGAGTDTVLSTATAYTLGNNVDNLTFVGSGGFTGTGNGIANTLIGGTGADSLSGLGGSDRLEGGAGNDMLSGGAVSDTFVFKPGFGKDTITDFTVATGNHDVIEFSTSVFANWTALQAALTDSAAGAVITLDANDTITLTGVTKAQLIANHVNDFLFV